MAAVAKYISHVFWLKYFGLHVDTPTCRFPKERVTWMKWHIFLMLASYLARSRRLASLGNHFTPLISSRKSLMIQSGSQEQIPAGKFRV
jgi:hypothetical protein